MAIRFLVLVPLLLAVQCDGDAAPDAHLGVPDAGTPLEDSGPRVLGTVGVPASDVDGSDSPESLWDSPPDAQAQQDLDALAACYDDPSVGGCEGTGCRTLGACCVGQGDCCSPLPEASPTDPTSCADLSCLGTSWRMFGLQASLSPDGLTPQGTATGEGGLVSLTPIPLHNTRAAFTFTLTPPEDCSGSCLESLSVGLLRAPPPPGPEVVAQPVVALTYSGSRDSVAVMLSGHERSRFERGTMAPFTLSLEPTGRVLVTHDDVSIALDDAFSPDPLYLAVWGRSRNPGASDRRSVALASLRTELARCDMPQAWDARQETQGVQGSAPSLATDGVHTRLAYVDDGGAIRIAERDGFGQFIPLPARLEASNVSYAEHLDDPELVFRDGTWELFFTARDGENVRVGHASLSGDTFNVNATPLLEGAWAPTFAASLGGRWVMIARSDDGLQSYVETPEGLVLLLGSRLNDTVAGLLGTVGRPSLVLHDRAWHLYVPVRRGTRWSIELFASEEALVWRHVGPTLSPSGQGFDRLGVLNADAMALGDRVELVYEGDDGVQRRLGWASRTSTAEGRRW